MKIKVLKAKKIIISKARDLEDVYILNCLGEELIEKYFEKNKPLKIMNKDKEIAYINPKYIVCYRLYNELVEIDV